MPYSSLGRLAGATILLIFSACGSGSSESRSTTNPPNGGASGTGGSGATSGAGSGGRQPDAMPEPGGSGGLEAGPDTTHVDPPPDAGTLDQACADLAGKSCARYEQCSRRMLADLYATLADCVTIESTRCQELMSLPGVQGGVAEIRRLASLVAGRSCGLHVATPSLLVEQRGTLPGGAACRNGLQCASRFCQQEGIECGTCAEVGDAPSDRCRTYREASWCEDGRLCNTGGLVCVTPPRGGEPCLSNGTCGVGFFCHAGRCDTLKFPGETCDPEGSPLCLEMPCDPVSRKCPAADGGNPAGSACGGISSEPGYCAIGLGCVVQGDGPGICRPHSRLGAPCAGTGACPISTQCVGGKCELPSLVGACR